MLRSNFIGFLLIFCFFCIKTKDEKYFLCYYLILQSEISSGIYQGKRWNQIFAFMLILFAGSKSIQKIKTYFYFSQIVISTPLTRPDLLLSSSIKLRTSFGRLPFHIFWISTKIKNRSGLNVKYPFLQQRNLVRNTKRDQTSLRRRYDWSNLIM